MVWLREILQFVIHPCCLEKLLEKLIETTSIGVSKGVLNVKCENNESKRH